MNDTIDNPDVDSLIEDKELYDMTKKKMSDHYVSRNLCHELVPEISKQTEEAYRFHPACRPEAVVKREAAKEARRAETT